MEQYNEWTSCEFYGHYFKDGHCVDCGEVDEDSTSVTEETDK